MSLAIFNGLTSQTVDLFIQDTASTTGGGKTGLVFNTSGLSIWYRKGATGTLTQITLATQTVGGAWSSGGFVEIDSTNSPGLYRLDLPNAAVDTSGFTTVTVKGTALVMAPVRIDCRPVNTVTNLTNAPTAGDLTATMKASVTSAATSSTPTVTLAAATHTGAVIPTVTTLTNLPTAPTDWLTAAAVKADAVTKIQMGLATAASITALTNLSALCNLNGPTVLEIPDSSSKSYPFTVAVRDSEGKLVDLDANPAITAFTGDGTSRTANIASVTKAGTGLYTFLYNVSSTHASEPIRIKSVGAVSSEERYAELIVSVVDYDALTTLLNIWNKVQNLSSDPADQSAVEAAITAATANLDVAVSTRLATSGYTAPLSAADTRTALGLASANLDTQLSAIDDFLDTEVAAIKAKTDNLPTDPADQSLIEVAITSAVASLATSSSVADIAAVTDKLDTAMVLDGSVYQFTTNALELAPSSGGGGTTVVVHPGYASWAEKVAGQAITLFHNEAGTVGPIRVQSRTGTSPLVTDVDLSALTGLYFLVVAYDLSEVYRTSDVTISGTENSQFTVPVTTDLTGTITAETDAEWHYWSLRDADDTVISTGRLRVRQA